MAFAVVSAQARVRESAGISYVLFPPEADELQAGAFLRQDSSTGRQMPPGPRTHGQTYQPGRPPAGPRPWQRPGQQPGQQQAPSRQPAAAAAGPRDMAPNMVRDMPPRAQRAPGAAQSQARQVQQRPVPQDQTARTTARPGSDIVRTWPADWQALFARTKPGRVAWTYYGLGHDLCGTPNTARRKKLADLIAFLRLPKGTHTFWPIGLPAQDEDGNTYLAVNKDIFWQGLQLLNARMLIIMGSPAARSAGITGHISPTMPMRPINGMLTLLTWDIDHLDTENHYIQTQAYLRQTLSPLFN